jgi:small subunit ribosomal protein S25e
MTKMGSKKRLTLKQMEKIGKKKERKEKGSRTSGSTTEKRALRIVPPDPRNKKVVDQLKKMRVLTPYTVATRFDLRLSAARDLLEELEKQGAIEFVSGSKNLKIYKPSD